MDFFVNSFFAPCEPLTPVQIRAGPLFMLFIEQSIDLLPLGYKVTLEGNQMEHTLQNSNTIYPQIYTKAQSESVHEK